MNSWVDEEADKHRLEQEKVRNKEFVIKSGNYWAKLLDRIRRDIDSINNNHTWNPGDKAIVEMTESQDHYKIAKKLNPQVVLKLTNRGDEIDLQVQTFIGNDTRHTFIVEVDDADVYLLLGKERFLVPEDASRRILEPIIESLKTRAN